MSSRQSIVALIVLPPKHYSGIKQSSSFIEQGLEITSDNSPYEIIGNLIISVDQTISKSNNFSRVCKGGFERGIELQQAIQRFPDDTEFTFNSRAKQFIAPVITFTFVFEKPSESGAGLDNII